MDLTGGDVQDDFCSSSDRDHELKNDIVTKLKDHITTVQQKMTVTVTEFQDLIKTKEEELLLLVKENAQLREKVGLLNSSAQNLKEQNLRFQSIMKSANTTLEKQKEEIERLKSITSVRGTKTACESVASEDIRCGVEERGLIWYLVESKNYPGFFNWIEESSLPPDVTKVPTLQAEHKKALENFEKIKEKQLEEKYAQIALLSQQLALVTHENAKWKSSFELLTKQNEITVAEARKLQLELSEELKRRKSKESNLEKTMQEFEIEKQNLRDLLESSANDRVNQIQWHWQNLFDKHTACLETRIAQQDQEIYQLKNFIELERRKTNIDQKTTTPPLVPAKYDLIEDSVLNSELKKCREKKEVTSMSIPNYSKNVLIKFLASDPKGASDHEALLPVLFKLFKISSNDIEVINNSRKQISGRWWSSIKG